MSIFSKLFGKKSAEAEDTKVDGIENFMVLIRVYYQSVMASNLGITNINYLPDMALFKRSLKVPTQNGKLGVAEKSRARKMLMDIYGVDELFCKEIDSSIKKNCKTVNDVQSYLFLFQGFSNDLMVLIGNLMKWKMRTPGFMSKVLYNLTQKSIHDILNKNNWKDEAVAKTCATIRKYKKSLGFSEEWMVEYVYNIVKLAKKEPKNKVDQ